MKKISYIAVAFFLLICGFFARQSLLGKLPIPADTIVGLYYPFRDHYGAEYPRGIPYKNFLITDPVRQTYPWRYLAVSLEKQFILPLWNPYEMAGYPLLANLQSAPLYPLNFLFFLMPFSWAWSSLILLQPLLAGYFLYLCLRNKKLHPLAGMFGGLVFAFSGFMVSWLEWGTVGQAALWLPLVLLSIDKIMLREGKKFSIWPFIFVFSLTCSFLAGHLQTFFYLLLVSVLYIVYQWRQKGRQIKTLMLFAGYFILFILITAVQWIPFTQFLLESARNVDQTGWQAAGWFIPWQHVAGFLAPDFFGNPTTLNYWGVWNYGELTGYIGVFPLLLVFFSFFAKQKRDALFFGGVALVALLLALPTPLAKLPFQLSLPFFSTAQPTRLLFVVDFTFAVLSALGLDFLIKEKTKKVFIVLGVCLLLYGVLWIIVLGKVSFIHIDPASLLVAKHNLYLPTILFLLSAAGIAAIFFLPKKLTILIICILILATAGDLVRFADKFTPFTSPAYLYPNTRVLNFLIQHAKNDRIMETDSRILPPNFSVMYHLQSIDGYDPLYLLRYGEYAAAIGRGRPDITSPFGFNRIITPQRTDSPLINLLGVKYILSFDDLLTMHLKKVYAFGQTKVYENKNALPRAFFVQNIIIENLPQAQMHDLFNEQLSLRKTAIIDGYDPKNTLSFSSGSAAISTYGPSRVTIKTDNSGEGFLVLTDMFYPTWHASICDSEGQNCQGTMIYRTDFAFRGVRIPRGQHSVVFRDSLF